MAKRTLLILVVLLSGCAVEQDQEVHQGIWHENENLGPFSESWSSCHHFRATTSDLRWMLDVDVSVESGSFDASKLVALLDFSTAKNRECEVSLYKDNDIACGDNEPVRIPASEGQGVLRHDNRVPDWKSTFDIDLRDLVFDYGDQEIRIDHVSFTNIVYSNFCPG